MEVVFNVYDGVIIISDMNSAVQRRGHGNQRIPAPKFSSWRDIVWHRWTTLHNAGASPNSFGDEFPPEQARPADRDRFRSQTASGRYRSEEGADLSFYQSIDITVDLPRMKSFLNYVIFSDKTIQPAEEPMILTCLQSRIPDVGLAPVFGYHETFECGHWAFYAMLSTLIGRDLVWFLAEHKSDGDLGHKLIQSVTLFAADNYTENKSPTGPSS